MAGPALGALAGLAVVMALLDRTGQAPTAETPVRVDRDNRSITEVDMVSFTVEPASHLIQRPQRLTVSATAAIGRAQLAIHLARVPARITVTLVGPDGAGRSMRTTVTQMRDQITVDGLDAGVTRWTVKVGSVTQTGTIDIPALPASTPTAPEPVTPPTPSVSNPSGAGDAGGGGGGGKGGTGGTGGTRNPGGPVGVHDQPAPGPQ